MTTDTINADVLPDPDDQLDVLSKTEIQKLLDGSQGGLYQRLRTCALAVLNCGSESDDVKSLIDEYASFDISLLQEERGIKLRLFNAPVSAFVDGQMIKGIKQHLYAIVRDIIYVNHEIMRSSSLDLNTSSGITDAVFHILRNARVLNAGVQPRLVVCWGGHAISREEYDYSKEVGYQLGLRGLDICTGCGPGAMKGPMKGATIAHAKQQITRGKYVGLSEPGIIMAETPNPIVNNLVIMPDIEKRLEAFVRIGHAIVVFPGGVGTAEEILYTLAILLNPENRNMPLPLIFTGPASSTGYFSTIEKFLVSVFGEEIKNRFSIIIDDPEAVGRGVMHSIQSVRQYRDDHDDAYYFNWGLKMHHDLQLPFIVTHDNVRNLNLHRHQEQHLLAGNLRRAFSAIVAGNVKEEGIRLIKEHGVFEINGDRDIMHALDELLRAFCEQKRMRRSDETYQPCYKVSGF